MGERHVRLSVQEIFKNRYIGSEPQKMIDGSF